ncbi:MAG: protein-L-isoaspartate O-methyltransferase family protein, partial [Planctomycetia bacterium]
MSGRAAGMILVAVLAASDATAAQTDSYAPARERMVRDDIAAGGVTDPRVLESMRLTPRHEFVPMSQRAMAYFDMSLPIGESQTISGPFVVASMTEKLEPKPTDRVLEIGTGSGYQAAVLSPLVGTVYSIEIHRELGERAAKTLKRLGYRNVVTKIGDGFAGWPEHAPFD